MKKLEKRSTGIKSFDDTIDYLRVGDNVVFQVDSVKEYLEYVASFVDNAIKENRKIIYFRFAEHNELVAKKLNVKRYELDANQGFESFSKEIHDIAKKEGEDTYYVFDCLSYLLPSWASDLMIGNFFYITCPYLYELNTIAYFSLLKNSHSYNTVATIRETTQLLLNIYKTKGKKYLQPLKVYERYNPTMFLPHEISDGEYLPVTESEGFSEILKNNIEKDYLTKSEERNLDYWDRIFIEAKNIYLETRSKKDEKSVKRRKKILNRLIRIILTKDDKVISLIKKYFNLRDLLEIKTRLIGSGMIGGKALGMLLARKILEKSKFAEDLEPHDSFYIGSDVFYSYIVQNGWWMLRMEQRTKEGYFETAKELKEKILTGKFPSSIREKFLQILEYFGQAPIIVRSSSLLEDSFGNAFAGKYESYFCINQKDPKKRYEEFETAIRKVYASSMSQDALAYRLQRDLEKNDEQMCILVQRVSGSYHDKYFFPDLAGVGISYNTYVWSEEMDPRAGMLRLVYGLGTRAVDRTDDDYPRIVSLDRPLLKPFGSKDEIRQFSQHYMDLLSLSENKISKKPIDEMNYSSKDKIMRYIAEADHETKKRMNELGIKNKEPYILTFDRLFKETNLSKKMQNILKEIEKAYNYPVDIEFTVNFNTEFNPRINLLQCRPLQVKGLSKAKDIKKDISIDDIFIKTKKNFMGGNADMHIDYVIYIEAKEYVNLSQSEKYDVARLVGRVNRILGQDNNILLMGPGRWGTTTPALGVPVSFFEINKAKAIVEYSSKEHNYFPELSFGSHFFQDLVETDIFYIAVFDENVEVIFNKEILNKADNYEKEGIYNNEKMKEVVKIYSFEKEKLILQSDIVMQEAIAYIK